MDARLMALTNTDLTARRCRRPFPRRSFFSAQRAGDSRAAAARARRGYSRRSPRIFSRGSARCTENPRRRSIPPRCSCSNSTRGPGNVRELKNAIEHALVFGKEVAAHRPRTFPEIVRATGEARGSAAALRSLEDLEREAIRATLEATHYKIGRAAEILGISRKTLLEKRKKYELL